MYNLSVIFVVANHSLGLAIQKIFQPTSSISSSETNRKVIVFPFTRPTQPLSASQASKCNVRIQWLYPYRSSPLSFHLPLIVPHFLKGVA